MPIYEEKNISPLNDFVIRPLRKTDLDWLLSMSHIMDPGFTSLPDNKDYLAHRVDIVDKSFKEQIPPEERIFLFIRENLPAAERVGIAGIQDRAGFNTIFYNYEISTVSQMNAALNIHLEHKILNLVNDFQDATELISFWIHPDFRAKKLGRWLSYARLLFIAQFPEWFSEQIIAEIRGVSDASGNSPFWEAVCRDFFAMDFKKADYLTMTTDKQYIADLMPRMPIYIDLLPDSAKNVIGVPNASAAPAKAFLESQGFEFTNYIDIFDGGPLLAATRHQIGTIANSKSATVLNTTDQLQDPVKVIIGSAVVEMHSTLAYVQILKQDEIIIETNTAQILHLSPGAQVRYCLV